MESWSTLKREDNVDYFCMGLLPSFPEGSAPLALGVVGTTRPENDGLVLPQPAIFLSQLVSFMRLSKEVISIDAAGARAAVERVSMRPRTSKASAHVTKESMPM